MGYLALALMMAGTPVAPIQFVWFFLVDGPHVFATITRTHLDSVERAKLGMFLWVTVPLMLIRPASVLAGYGSVFFLLAVCWQQYHIVKQHLGFVMLYKAKNREKSRTDLLVDRAFLLASLFVPLAYFVIRTRPQLSFLSDLTWIILPQYALLTTLWIGRQLQKLRRHSQMNWPKIGLFLVVVPLQWFALVHAASFGPDGIIRAGIVLGLFHSLQYHRLMWFHNRNRYGQEGAEEKHGLAARCASNVWLYVAIGVVLNAVFCFVPGTLIGGPALQAAVWGISFTHYLLDGRIWSVRNDHELAEALHLR